MAVPVLSLFSLFLHDWRVSGDTQSHHRCFLTAEQSVSVGVFSQDGYLRQQDVQVVVPLVRLQSLDDSLKIHLAQRPFHLWQEAPGPAGATSFTHVQHTFPLHENTFMLIIKNLTCLWCKWYTGVFFLNIPVLGPVLFYVFLHAIHHQSSCHIEETTSTIGLTAKWRIHISQTK